MVKTEKKYDLEASLSTATVILILFLLLWFIRLAVPDPPLNERGPGGGDGGYGLELAYAPVASEPSITPNTQPEPEQTVTETLPEETTEETPAEDPVISDNSSEDVIKVAEKKSDKKEKQVKKEPEKTTETSDKPAPKKKNTAIKEGDLFSDGDDNGGGDPNGNGKEGNGGKDGNGGPGSGGGEGNGIGVRHGLNGWNWSKPPRTDKTSPKNGEIVFNVEIDANGKVSNVTPKRYTVDYEIMQTYQEECYKLKFVKKNNEEMESGTTKGTITFSFKAR